MRSAVTVISVNIGLSCTNWWTQMLNTLCQSNMGIQLNKEQEKNNKKNHAKYSDFGQQDIPGFFSLTMPQPLLLWPCLARKYNITSPYNCCYKIFPCVLLTPSKQGYELQKQLKSRYEDLKSQCWDTKHRFEKVGYASIYCNICMICVYINISSI